MPTTLPAMVSCLVKCGGSLPCAIALIEVGRAGQSYGDWLPRTNATLSSLFGTEFPKAGLQWKRVCEGREALRKHRTCCHALRPSLRPSFAELGHFLDIPIPVRLPL